MFTIKFMSIDTSETSECPGAVLWRIVSAEEYDVYDKGNGSFEITANGVEYSVSKDKEHYGTCYIENSSGKTISTYVGCRINTNVDWQPYFNHWRQLMI